MSSTSKRNLFVTSMMAMTGVAIIYVIHLLTTPLLALSQVEATPQYPQYDEEALIQIALKDTFMAGGLVSTGDPVEDRAKVKLTAWTTLGEWDSLTGSAAVAPEAVKIGLSGGMPIFVVVIRGEFFEDLMPGLPNPAQIKGVVYDNKYVMVNPVTRQVVGTSAYGPGNSLPLYDDQTIAGGATAVFINPESTADVLPLP